MSHRESTIQVLPDDEASSAQTPKAHDMPVVRVRGLSRNTAPRHLSHIFGWYGPVERVNVFVHPSGSSRGTAFITFAPSSSDSTEQGQEDPPHKALRYMDQGQIDNAVITLDLVDGAWVHSEVSQIGHEAWRGPPRHWLVHDQHPEPQQQPPRATRRWGAKPGPDERSMTEQRAPAASRASYYRSTSERISVHQAQDSGPEDKRREGPRWSHSSRNEYERRESHHSTDVNQTRQARRSRPAWGTVPRTRSRSRSPPRRHSRDFENRDHDGTVGGGGEIRQAPSSPHSSNMSED